MEATDFLCKNKRAALWFSMGAGKTLATLATLSHDRIDSLPALIVAPKRVCGVWRREVAKWGFEMHVTIIDGNDKVGQLRRSVEEKTDLVIITPQSLHLAEKVVKQLGRMPWQSVVIDESTFFKSAQSKRWAVAAALCQAADRVITLTGSPMSGRGLIDVWAQIDLLSSPERPNPLGGYQTFLGRWFYFDHFNRPRSRVGAESEVAELVAPLVLERKLTDMAGELIEIDEMVPSSPAIADATQQVLLEDGTAYVALRTVASGFMYDHHWTGEVTPNWIDDQKIEALETIVAGSPDENILVFTEFRNEAERLSTVFKAPVIYGGTSAKQSDKLIDNWNRGDLPMLIASSKSLGHGVNLQEASRRVVFFSLPDSGELYSQAVARLYRTGQPHSVVVHRLIREDSIDSHIAGLLVKKLLTEANVRDYVNQLREKASA